MTTANTASMNDAVAAYKRGDYAQAFKIIRPLAAQGDARAQRNLGNMYREGQGVSQDYKEALKWYRLAQHKGLHQHNITSV